VENVLVRKGKTWYEQVSFNFCYIAQRVRRRILPRKMLHLCVNAAYDSFIDQTTSKTGKQIFNKIAEHIASNMIKALYQGDLSALPSISWYTPLLMTDGKSQDTRQGRSAFVMLLSWNNCIQGRSTWSRFLLQRCILRPTHTFQYIRLFKHHWLG
jgi:hypothetical protein